MYSIHSVYHLFLKCLKLLTDLFTWVSGSWTIQFAFLWRKDILSSTLSEPAPMRQRLTLHSQVLTFLWDDYTSPEDVWLGHVTCFINSLCNRTNACFLPDPWILSLLPGHWHEAASSSISGWGRRVQWSHSSAANQQVTKWETESPMVWGVCYTMIAN